MSTSFTFCESFFSPWFTDSCMHHWMTMSGISTREAKEQQYERNLNILNIDEEVMLTRAVVGGHELSVALDFAFFRNQKHVESFLACLSEF